MLLVAQVPLADARPFEHDEVRRLTRPRFDLGFDPQSAGFVRSFGALQERAPGLPADWPAEDLYCHAARAVQIDTAQLKVLKRSTGGPGQFVPVMRRLLSNGEAVGRAEIWLARTPRHPLRQPMTDRDVEHLLEDFATMRVGCRSGDRLTEATVLTMGKLLAAQVLASTTKRSEQPDGFAPKGWWVTPGRPLLLFQYAHGDVAALPFAATAVPVDNATMTLHHMSVGGELVWLVGLSARANTARVRELRLHLMRLHCEHEVARMMVTHIIDDRLVATDGLEHYLERTSGLLSRTLFYKHPPSATLKIAYQYAEHVTAAQRSTLEQRVDEQLENCRETVRAAAKQFTYLF